MAAGIIRSFVELLDESDPLLALAIHNGHELPESLQQNCGIGETDRLREEDPFTEVFADAFPNKMIVYTSRFAVDLNRSPEKCVYQVPDDCWGLVPRLQPLSDEILSELHEDYQRWYSSLTFTVNRLLVKHPFLLVLDLHSFNHRRQGKDAYPDPQEQNPDIILGRNNMPSAFYDWVENLRKLLDRKEICGHKIDCRIDVKFTGGWLSRWLHKSFPDKVLCLAVEFKKIFMDEWTGVVDNDFQMALASEFKKAVDLNLKHDFTGV
ncbi:MAG: N-formylglutamate amidohydrolase [Candidatus Cloacimonetes bacterium]|nr:N-formylglutamate amidohydrolase [Candidatus Cloacimonadota bacterium]